MSDENKKIIDGVIVLSEFDVDSLPTPPADKMYLYSQDDGAGNTITKIKRSNGAEVEVVNTSDTQTLTNKIIGNGNSVQFTALTGLPTTLYGYNISNAARVVGNTVSFFGDSITYYGEGYPYYAEVLSSGKLRLHSVNSNAGYTTTNLLDVINQITGQTVKPKYCIVLAGTNDAIAGTSIEVLSSGLTSIYNKLMSVDIVPIASTIPPLNGANNELARSYNNWIKKYSSVNGLNCIDFYDSLSAKNSGWFNPVFDNGDGIHPNNTGNYIMGLKVANTISPILPITSLPLSDANTGGGNLIGNSWFLDDSDLNGISNGWSATPSSGFFYSRVSDPRGFYWQRVSLSGSSGTKQLLSNTISFKDSTFTTGETVLVGARFRTFQSGSNTSVKLQFTCYNDGYTNPFNTILPGPLGMTQIISDGVAIREITIPSGRTFAQLSFVVGGGTGIYEFAQPTIINLSKLGF